MSRHDINDFSPFIPALLTYEETYPVPFSSLLRIHIGNLGEFIFLSYVIQF
jgi:hypothetical protein